MQSQLPQKSGFGLLKYFVKTTLKILQGEKNDNVLLLDEGTKKFFYSILMKQGNSGKAFGIINSSPKTTSKDVWDDE